MAFTGGDVIEATIQHSTLGLLRLEPKGSEDTEIDIGGYVNVDDDAMITGSGTKIISKNRKPWIVMLPPVGYSKDDDTLIALQNIQNSELEAVFTFTIIDGTVYKGTGQIFGDLKGNLNTGLIGGFKTSGGGTLERIA